MAAHFGFAGDLPVGDAIEHVPMEGGINLEGNVQVDGNAPLAGAVPIVEPAIIQAVTDGNLKRLADLYAAAEEAEDDMDILETQNSRGQSVLACAVIHNQPQIVKFLIDHGALLEERCVYEHPEEDDRLKIINNATPYAIAARQGNAPMMRLLLSCGAQMNVFVVNGEVDERLQRRIDLIKIVPKKTESEQIQLAAKKLVYLVKKGRNLPNDDLSLYKNMKECINLGAHFLQRFEIEYNDCLSLFHLAVRRNNLDAIHALSLLCPNPDIMDSNGNTPLMRACEQGKIPTIKALLSGGANFNKTEEDGSIVPLENQSGTTCLMYATQHIKALKYLIKECHVSVNASNSSRETVLMYAVSNGEVGAVRYLLTKSPEKPNLTAIDSKSRAILQILFSNDNLGDEDQTQAILHLLVDAGVNIDFRNNYKEIVRYINSSQFENKEELLAILQANYNLLRLAKGENVKKTLEELLAKGANVNVRGIGSLENGQKISGAQALHLAAMNGNIDLVIKLLEEGADPKASDDHGFNPAHHAAANKHYDCQAMLLLYPLNYLQQKDNLDFKKQCEEIVKIALRCSESIAIPCDRAKMLTCLGKLLRENFGLEHYAKDCFNMIAKLNLGSATMNLHSEAHVNLAEMALVGIDTSTVTLPEDERKLSLEEDMTDDTFPALPSNTSEHASGKPKVQIEAEMRKKTEVSKENAEAALKHLVSSRFIPGTLSPVTFAFSQQVTNAYLGGGLSVSDRTTDNSMDLTTAEGVMQLAEAHNRERRKSANLTAENDQLKAQLAQLRLFQEMPSPRDYSAANTAPKRKA